MSRESSLWSSLAKSRAIFGADLHIERVENLVAFGRPDVDGYLYTHFGQGSFWIELKAEERPARPETLVRFKVRDAQVEWNGKRWALGGRAFYLCQVGSGSKRVLYLLPGNMGAELRTGMTESELTTKARAVGGVFRGVRFQESLFRKIFEVRP